MHSEIKDITPAQAKEWLESRGKNRKVNTRRVRAWAAQMSKGNWRTTHQGVAFNTGGELVDGQHRLAAIIESGVTVRMMVTWGVDDLEVLDTGKMRSAGDTLTIAGWGDAKNLAASLRLIWCYDHVLGRPWSVARAELSNLDIERMATQIGDEVRANIADTRHLHKRIGGGIAPMMSALYLNARWAREHGVEDLFKDYLEGYTSGAGLEKADARLALASWNNGARRLIIRGNDAAEVWMLSNLRGFYAYVSGEPLSKILIRDASTYMYRLPGDAVRVPE